MPLGLLAQLVAARGWPSLQGRRLAWPKKLVDACKVAVGRSDATHIVHSSPAAAATTSTNLAARDLLRDPAQQA